MCLKRLIGLYAAQIVTKNYLKHRLLLDEVCGIYNDFDFPHMTSYVLSCIFSVPGEPHIGGEFLGNREFPRNSLTFHNEEGDIMGIMGNNVPLKVQSGNRIQAFPGNFPPNDWRQSKMAYVW